MKKYVLAVLLFTLFFGGMPTKASTLEHINIYNSINTIEINNHTYDAKQFNIFLYNNTTYVPVRFVSEELGFNVKWDGNQQSITIGRGSGSDNAIVERHSTKKPYNETIDIYHNVKTLVINGVSYDEVSQNAFIYNNASYVL